MQLRLLTINSLGLPVTLPGMRRRLQALGRAIAAADVEIACLQEVGRWRYLALLHDTAHWPYAIAAAHAFMPRGGLVQLARLPVLNETYYRFAARGRIYGLHATERYQAKGVLQTTLAVGAERVVVMNTHLSANYSANWSRANGYARVERAQLAELAALINAVPRDTPLIVTGDFNVPRRSWLYQEFVAATDLYDPLAESGEHTYRPLPGLPRGAATALDHVFVRMPPQLAGQVEAELCFRDPVMLAHGSSGYLSDHLGVRVRIAWQPATASAPPAVALPPDPTAHDPHF